MKEIELSYWKDWDSNQPYKPTLSPANQQGVNCLSSELIRQMFWRTAPIMCCYRLILDRIISAEIWKVFRIWTPISLQKFNIWISKPSHSTLPIHRHCIRDIRNEITITSRNCITKVVIKNLICTGGFYDGWWCEDRIKNIYRYREPQEVEFQIRVRKADPPPSPKERTSPFVDTSLGRGLARPTITQLKALSRALSLSFMRLDFSQGFAYPISFTPFPFEP